MLAVAQHDEPLLVLPQIVAAPLAWTAQRVPQLPVVGRWETTQRMAWIAARLAHSGLQRSDLRELALRPAAWAARAALDVPVLGQLSPVNRAAQWVLTATTSLTGSLLPSRQSSLSLLSSIGTNMTASLISASLDSMRWAHGLALITLRGTYSIIVVGIVTPVQCATNFCIKNVLLIAGGATLTVMALDVVLLTAFIRVQQTWELMREGRTFYANGLRSMAELWSSEVDSQRPVALIESTENIIPRRSDKNDSNLNMEDGNTPLTITTRDEIIENTSGNEVSTATVSSSENVSTEMPRSTSSTSVTKIDSSTKTVDTLLESLPLTKERMQKSTLAVKGDIQEVLALVNRSGDILHRLKQGLDSRNRNSNQSLHQQGQQHYQSSGPHSNFSPSRQSPSSQEESDYPMSLRMTGSGLERSLFHELNRAQSAPLIFGNATQDNIITTVVPGNKLPAPSLLSPPMSLEKEKEKESALEPLIEQKETDNASITQAADCSGLLSPTSSKGFSDSGSSLSSAVLDDLQSPQTLARRSPASKKNRMNTTSRKQPNTPSSIATVTSATTSSAISSVAPSSAPPLPSSSSSSPQKLTASNDTKPSSRKSFPGSNRKSSVSEIFRALSDLADQQSQQYMPRAPQSMDPSSPQRQHFNQGPLSQSLSGLRRRSSLTSASASSIPSASASSIPSISSSSSSGIFRSFNSEDDMPAAAAATVDHERNSFNQSDAKSFAKLTSPPSIPIPLSSGSSSSVFVSAPALASARTSDSTLTSSSSIPSSNPTSVAGKPASNIREAKGVKSKNIFNSSSTSAASLSSTFLEDSTLGLPQYEKSPPKERLRRILNASQNLKHHDQKIAASLIGNDDENPIPAMNRSLGRPPKLAAVDTNSNQVHGCITPLESPLASRSKMMSDRQTLG